MLQVQLFQFTQDIQYIENIVYIQCTELQLHSNVSVCLFQLELPSKSQNTFRYSPQCIAIKSDDFLSQS